MPESMSFRLDDCEVDAIELIAMSAAASARRALSPTEAARVQRMLSACQGIFLPEFESIEDLATDRHPSCTELIHELRDSLTNKRVDLALLLSDIYLGAGRPAEAIAVLEPAVNNRRERKDLADRLASAYRGAGREAEAKALEARFE
jgi:predicted Zn-dependent protease